jgi:hypothetical protein
MFSRTEGRGYHANCRRLPQRTNRSVRYIVVPNSAYIAALPSDPSAKWLGATSEKAAVSALYAIPFTVSDPQISSAVLDQHYAVDNAVNGVFINGSRISGNSHDGDYHSEFRFLRDDIGPLRTAASGRMEDPPSCIGAPGGHRRARGISSNGLANHPQESPLTDVAFRACGQPAP